ncbi:SDR family NAD(P)-dependent oxidoreductase [Streptomyces achromogenes]|uniref:SDR family NAD(P)-dependent oxidoreductase n=1 Tax=Streptomyces achromogenes TaxID=67255 RepID=UPI0036869E19
MSEHAPGPGAVPGAPALRGRTVVLIGGGSGIGLRVAHQVVAAGAEVVLGGRTAQRLAAAARELGPAASWRTVDITDRASPAAFFAPLERVDHLFTSAASYRVGPMRP